MIEVFKKAFSSAGDSSTCGNGPPKGVRSHANDRPYASPFLSAFQN